MSSKTFTQLDHALQQETQCSPKREPMAQNLEQFTRKQKQRINGNCKI